MKSNHTLTEQLVMGYAAGVLPPAFDLIVASHISMCDESRAMVGTYEAVGGCILEQCKSVDLGASAFATTMRKIKEKDTTPKPSPKQCKIFPKPLLDFVGGDIATVKWRPLGNGVRQAILINDAEASVRLFHIPAGKAVPEHGHNGTEITLVLQGSYSDKVDRFERGDIEVASEDLNHQPIAGTECDCICLAAADAPLEFKGWISRLLQPYFKI